MRTTRLRSAPLIAFTSFPETKGLGTEEIRFPLTGIRYGTRGGDELSSTPAGQPSDFDATTSVRAATPLPRAGASAGGEQG